MEKQSADLPFMRNASDPYTIPLGRDDYYLSKEAFYNTVDKKIIKKKSWFFPRLKFISFEKGKLKLQCIGDKISHTLTIDIEKDKLHVSCSCGEQVQTLCVHAYKTFDRLMMYEGTDYFQEFRPGGSYELARSHRKYFTIAKGNGGTAFRPKEILGKVYAVNSTLAEKEVTETISASPGTGLQPDKKSEVLCYMIVNIGRKEHPPFVLPCLGKLNKEGTAIKIFYPFLTGIQKQYQSLLTDEQKMLNEQCLLLYKEAEKLSGRLFSVYSEDVINISRYAAYFDHWKKLLVELIAQPYVFTTVVYRKRHLTGKPLKGRSRQITLLPYRPQLIFCLVDKGDFFQLQLKAKLGDKMIHSIQSSMPFFMQDRNNLYLFASPLDAYLVQWLTKMGSRITIFKEHFKDFETNLLSYLQKRYEVMKIKHVKKGKNKKI